MKEMEERKNVFSSWSGGKDCSLACYKAMEAGFEVSHLLNLLAEDGKRERAHGTRPFLLRLQAEALGIPIVQVNASWEGYESEFKAAVQALKVEGVEGGIFGDIDLVEHRAWVERVCNELEINPILPLWSYDPEDLLLEFINAGFEALVVATRVKEEWLGRRINRSFINELKEFDFHLSGESGEYHTFVVDGPIFKRRINVNNAERVRRGDSWFLDIKEGELE
jgi:diphthine-ammonia ligase